MSFFGNLDKIIEVEINEVKHQFLCLKLKDIKEAQKVDTLASSGEIEKVQEALSLITDLLVKQYYVKDESLPRPTKEDFEEFNVDLLKDVFGKLASSSQPIVPTNKA